MTNGKQKIIDEILKNFKSNRHFETEHFIYWVRERYLYNGDEVTRDEFKCIKDYVIKHGTLPCMLTPGIDDELKMMPHHKGYEYGIHKNKVLRYSKTYDSLEMYDHDSSIRTPHTASTDRVLVIAKKKSHFKINSKNYVLIGKRWLSLKNWQVLKNHICLKDNVSKALMSAMLGGKDWISNLEIKNIPIQNKNSRRASSIGEAIEFECRTKPVKFLMNIFDVDEIIFLYSIINPNKIHYITNFIKDNKSQIEHLLKRHSEKISELLYYYFLCKDNRCDKEVMFDYFRMLREEGQELNLSISSYVTLKKRHDKISRDILKNKDGGGKLRVAKIYPNIKSLPGMEVEKIKSVRRLFHESQILHHCVHGYKERINSGYCAIYSILFNGERYTLQIGVYKIPVKEGEKPKHELNIVQLKGRFNCDAPDSIKEGLELMCKRNGIRPLETSSIRLRTINFEDLKRGKKEIVQRGVSILDDLVQGKRVGETRDLFELDNLPF